MITEKEILIARHCISHALTCGASAIRVSLNKSLSDTCTVLNGELDKITHSADRSIYFYLFVDGRYGTFSTNRLEEQDLDKFISDAIDMTRMLAEDQFRKLPDPARTAKDAKTGKELGLYDASFGTTDDHARINKALSLSHWNEYGEAGHGQESGAYPLPVAERPDQEQTIRGFKVISEECEYSESCEDSYVIDSQGFEGRHTETCFGTFSEVTIEDESGCKYSGFWWETSPKSSELPLDCSLKACERAHRQIGPKKRRSGTYRMVVDRTCATRLISPILTALNASSIQQKMSFLEGSIGKSVFPEGMNLIDMARTPGGSGSRLFDTEGVATKEAPLIEKGVVKQFFVNTYMSGKTGMEPTIEDVSRPCLTPFIKGDTLASNEKEVSLKDILGLCTNGIYVTGFNGGNCNPVTGDYSFGIEGFAFSKGKITHPVREMLITGNLMELWNNLIAAGSDARKCSRWQIGSLAFENVSFSS